jgi:hypothetical protein
VKLLLCLNTCHEGVYRERRLKLHGYWSETNVKIWDVIQVSFLGIFFTTRHFINYLVHIALNVGIIICDDM